ncbi:60S ribosomal protein L6, partial [Clarias magur]
MALNERTKTLVSLTASFIFTQIIIEGKERSCARRNARRQPQAAVTTPLIAPGPDASWGNKSSPGNTGEEILRKRAVEQH